MKRLILLCLLGLLLAPWFLADVDRPGRSGRTSSHQTARRFWIALDGPTQPPAPPRPPQDQPVPPPPPPPPPPPSPCPSEVLAIVERPLRIAAQTRHLPGTVQLALTELPGQVRRLVDLAKSQARRGDARTEAAIDAAVADLEQRIERAVAQAEDRLSGPVATVVLDGDRDDEARTGRDRLSTSHNQSVAEADLPPVPEPSTVPKSKAKPVRTRPGQARHAEPAREPGRQLRIVSGKRSSEDRALADLQERIEEQVGDWLRDAGVPGDWQPPERLVRGLVVGRPEVELVETRDYAELYQASVPLSLEPSDRARLVRAYRQQVATERFTRLGAGLACVLAALGLVTGYIRTDEATRGYYTRHLRAGLIVGLGAAGVVLYRLVA